MKLCRLQPAAYECFAPMTQARDTTVYNIKGSDCPSFTDQPHLIFANNAN